MQLSCFVSQLLPRFRVLSGLVALCPLGCSSTPSSHGSTPVAYSDFANTMAQAYCSSINDCCIKAGYDASTCESSLKAEFTAMLATMAADPKIVYDPAAAARLVDAVKTVNTACTDPTLSSSMNISWNDVFHGTVGPGGACGSSQDCIKPDGGYVTCNAGVCAPEAGPTSLFDGPHASLGQSCSDTCINSGNGSSCSGTAAAATGAGNCWTNDGLYCSGTTCTEVAKIGQTCSGGNYCEAAGHCENSSDTCVAATATGACMASDACVSTSYCDYTAQVCTPKKANGAACNQDTECTGGQCEQDHCRNWSVATAATCAGLLDD